MLHRAKEERNILHTIQRRKANWIGHILRWNCFLKKKKLLKEGYKEGQDEEEDVSRYWMTLRKGEDAGN